MVGFKRHADQGIPCQCKGGLDENKACNSLLRWERACSKIKTSQSQHSKFEHMLHLLGWGQVGRKGIVTKY